MKKILIFFIGFIIVFTCNVSAAEYNVSSEAELINALSVQTEKDIIYLNKDIIISGPLTITGNVLINGNDNFLSYDESYNGTIFNVIGNLEISNLTFFGNNMWSWKNEDDRLSTEIRGDETTLNLGDKFVNSNVIEVTGTLKIENTDIIGYYIDSSSDASSFIKINGANSSVIVDYCAIYALYGTFLHIVNGGAELNNSTVTYSYGIGNKGALFKVNGGDLIINNSELSNNCGVARSGSLIGAVNNALVTFNSGAIHKNIAKYYGSNSTGSMITLESGAGFIMNDGLISNNIGTLSSVISTRWTNDPDDRGIFLNGGIIRNNTTTKTTWLNSSVFLRSSAVIGKNMIIDGDVVVNNTNASMENNGTINGKVTLNDSTSKAINNGVINDLDFLNGEFTNNNSINNVYELNTQIINNGIISGNYIKEITNVEGKIKVRFDIKDGKEKETGYSIVDKLYDLNYKFTEDDIIEVERNGYIFEGWFTDLEYTNKFEPGKELTENLTLYAKWKEIPVIAVPDTYLGMNVINIIFGAVLILFGSIMIYLIMSKDTIKN